MCIMSVCWIFIVYSLDLCGKKINFVRYFLVPGQKDRLISIFFHSFDKHYKNELSVDVIFSTTAVSHCTDMINIIFSTTAVSH